MKRIVTVLFIASLLQPSAFGWSLFRGKTAYWISVGMMAAAHLCDYSTTEQNIQSGSGHEANPALQKLVLNRHNFFAFKIGAGVVPVVAEQLLLRKHETWRPAFTVGNLGIAGSIGAVAWKNHQIYVQAGSPPVPQ